MQVFNYNTITKDRRFEISQPAYKTFTDDLSSKDSKRKDWDNMLLHLQKNKIKGTPSVVKVKSMEALQAKGIKDFYRMIDEVIKYGGSVYSMREEATFTNVTPRGISNNPEEFEKSKKSLEEKEEHSKEIEILRNGSSKIDELRGINKDKGNSQVATNKKQITNPKIAMMVKNGGRISI